ncbi:MAG: hypothetical protein ABUS49_13040 [Acidobacteriota bacterium]
MKKLLLLLLACSPAQGALITEVIAYYFLPNPPGALGSVCQDVGEAQALCTAGPISMTAAAGYGVLDVSANATAGGSIVLALGRFDDQLTIDTGSSGDGFVQYSFFISAQGSDESPGAACTPASLEVFQDGASLGSSSLLSPNSCPAPYDGVVGGTFTSDLAPFTSSVPFIFSAQAYLMTINPQGSDAHYGAFTTSLYAALTGISIFDSSGQLLPDARITSASSTYGGLAAAPEPSLAAAAFLLLAALVAAAKSGLVRS